MVPCIPPSSYRLFTTLNLEAYLLLSLFVAYDTLTSLVSPSTVLNVLNISRSISTVTITILYLANCFYYLQSNTTDLSSHKATGRTG